MPKLQLTPLINLASYISSCLTINKNAWCTHHNIFTLPYFFIKDNKNYQQQHDHLVSQQVTRWHYWSYYKTPVLDGSKNRICKIIFYPHHGSWQRFSSGSWHAMTQFCLCSLVGRWHANSAAIYACSDLISQHSGMIETRYPSHQSNHKEWHNSFINKFINSPCNFKHPAQRWTLWPPGIITWCHTTSVLGKLTKYLRSANSFHFETSFEISQVSVAVFPSGKHNFKHITRSVKSHIFW